MTLINDSIIRVLNYILGWNNSFSYKGITLSAQSYARVGQWIQYAF